MFKNLFKNIELSQTAKKTKVKEDILGQNGKMDGALTIQGQTAEISL